jgi:hypothetical protein
MFKENKYTRWYFSIIESAKHRTSARFMDEHHIIPKCCGGTDERSNIAVLTKREHFICHLLLPRMVKSKDHQVRLNFALNYFKSSFTARMYELYRQKQTVQMTNLIWINDGTTNKRILPETIGEYSDWQFGRLPMPGRRSMTDSEKKRLGKTMKGRYKGGKNPAARRVRFKNKEYDCIKSAEKATGISGYMLFKSGMERL